jgi:hypothetical protein
LIEKRGDDLTMKNILLTTSMLLSLLVLPIHAWATEIKMTESQDSKPVHIVMDKYSNFLQSHKDIKIKAGLVDLNGDGVAEIVARFVSPETCTNLECHTVVLMYRNNGWQVLFDHMTNRLDTGPVSSGPSAQNMASLIVNGKEKWEWTGGPLYEPDMATLGELITPTDTTPTDISSVMANYLSVPVNTHMNSETLPAGGTAGDIIIGTADFNASNNVYPLLCGQVGCQHVILAKYGTGYRLIGTPIFSGATVLLNTKTKGVRDLALGDSMGYSIWRWDGSVYKASETSYPSPLTPSP